MYLVPVVLVQCSTLLCLVKCCWSKRKIDQLSLLFEPLVSISFDMYCDKLLFITLHMDITIFAPHFSTIGADLDVIWKLSSPFGCSPFNCSHMFATLSCLFIYPMALLVVIFGIIRSSSASEIFENIGKYSIPKLWETCTTTKQTKGYTNPEDSEDVLQRTWEGLGALRVVSNTGLWFLPHHRSQRAS